MKLRDAKIISLDTETTGLDTENDRICEVGWCRVRFDKGTDKFFAAYGHAQLINPGIPMPPEAAAIHHLTDTKLADAPAMQDWPKHLVADVIVAHNAKFDKAFCVQEGVIQGDTPWLCTYRLARHVYPDAPSHKNQVLRYWLGFEDVQGDAHTAGHDAEVTALILCSMLNEHLGERDPLTIEIEEIIKMAERPVYLTGKLGFGKHADMTWQECGRQDRGYLQWMAKQGPESAANPKGWDQDVWFTINQLLAGR